MAPKGKGLANKGKAPAAAPAKRKRDGVDDKTGKRRNREVLQFFEDEAGVDDDDNEFFSDDSLFDEIDDYPMDEAFDPVLKGKKDSLRPQNSSFVPKEEEMDEEEFDRMMEERYKSHLGFKYTGDDEARSLKERDSLLSSGDSTIWKIKCMVGREKFFTFCLMQKFVDLKSLGNKLEIISVFAIDHVKGFIFIEAEKESSLVEACRGLPGIYYTRVAPVNRNDLPQLLSVRNKSNNIAKGTWVRVKNGNYKGDLGQVVAVNNSRKKATVKLIPRIDLQALTEKYGGGVARRGKTAGIAVPAPRLISSSELEEFRPLIQYRRDRDTDKTFEILDGMMLKDGFLYKKVSLDSLSYWSITPSQEELLKFKSSENKDSDDLEWLTQLYGGSRKKRTLSNGKGLEKGESSSGMEKGERSSGMEKGERSSGLGKGESSGSGIHNKFELFELVCFGRKDYGLIVGIEKDGSYKIIKDGPDAPMVTFLKERELKNGPSDMRFTASDQQGKTISANDTVKVLEGSLKDRQGIIKQIYRGTVFIYDENEVENGGYLCCKAQFCQKMKLASDMNCEKGGASGAFDFEDSPSSPKSPLPPQTQWQSKDRNLDFKEGGKDEIFSIGQTLRIRVGPLKGHICRVLAIRYSDVTVKIDSQHKILLVKSEHLSEVRGKSSTLPMSEDLGSSPFKAFDLLGAEGNSGDWAAGAGAGASGDGDGWNTGGVSAERTSWPAFPGSSSVPGSESGTAIPLGSVGNSLKTDSESAWNNVDFSQKSSWGASSDDKAVGSGVQDGTWGQKGDGWTTASKEVASDPSSSWGVPAAGGGNQENGSKRIPSWGVSSTDKNAATDGNSWGKSGEGWNTAAKDVTSNQTSSWGASSDDKAVGSGVQDGTWGQKGDGWTTASKEVASDPSSSWGVPAAGGGNQENGSKRIPSWGVSSTDKNAATDGNSWGKSGEGWNTAAKDVTSNQTSSWGAPVVNTGEGWNTAAKEVTSNQTSSWGAPVVNTGEGWNTAAKEVTSNQTSSWGAPVVNTASKEAALDPCSSWDVPAAGDGNQAGGWGKKSDDVWKKAAQDDGPKKISSWGAPSTNNNASTDGKGRNTAAKEVISNQTSSWGVPAAVNEDQGGSTLGKLDGKSSVSKMSTTSSSWGKQGGQSSWSNKGEDSSWNKRVEESSFTKQGEDSTWGKQDGGSSWNKEGGESSWSKQQEGGSSWTKQGGESSWSKQQEGGSSWNKQGSKENVGWKGGESSWSKQEGGSSWSKQGADSTCSKEDGGGSSWNKQGGESSWGKGKQGGESSWGKQEGGSSWNKQGADEGGGWKSSSDGTGGSFVRGRGGGRGEGGWRGRGRGEGGWRGRGRGEGGWRGSGGGRGEGGWRGRDGGGRGDGGWRSGGRASWSGGEDTGNSGGGQGSWAEKQENTSWSKQGGDSTWGKPSGDSSWGKQGGDSGGSSGQGSWAAKQENSSWGKQGDGSSWGKKPGDSSWGKHEGNSGGSSGPVSWAEKQDNSSWNKQGGDSILGKPPGDSAWGKQGGDSGGKNGQGSWAEKQGNSSWGKQEESKKDVESSWGMPREDSSIGQQGGDSTWGKKAAGNSSWGKPENESGDGWKTGDGSSGGKTGGDSPWGKKAAGNSSWGKPENESGDGWKTGDGSSGGKTGGDSPWGKKAAGETSWGRPEDKSGGGWKTGDGSSGGKTGGDSSWGKKAAGDSSWGKPEDKSGGGWKTGDGSSGGKTGGDSSWGKKAAGDSSWGKPDPESLGGWNTGDGSSGGKTGWNSSTTDDGSNPSAAGAQKKTDPWRNKSEENDKGPGGWN